MEDKVSIIVPVYNSEKYIEFCIKSLVEQTYKNIEIICVIDGSKDNSLKILEKYANTYSNILLIKQENQGAMKARINGIKYAHGKYIMFVDADDWIKSDMIKNMIINANNADVIKCGIEKEEESGELKRIEIVRNKLVVEKKDFNKELFPILFSTNYLNNMVSQLIKKEILDGMEYQTNLRVAEDLNFVIDLYQKINNIVILPNTDYHYRKNDSSAVHTITDINVRNDLKDIVEVFGKIFNLVKENKIKIPDNIKKNVYLYIFKELTVYSTKIYYVKNNKSEKYIFDYLFSTSLYNEVKEQITLNDIKNYSSGVKYIMKLLYKKNIKLMLGYGKAKTLLAYKMNYYIKKIKGNRNERFN